jgi:hypothetical protein
MFRVEQGRKDSAFALYDGIYERIRGMLRTWVADRIDFKLEVGG